MPDPIFNKARDHLRSEVTRSTSQNVDAFAAYAEAALAEEQLFQNPEVSRGDSDECMVVLSAELSRDAGTVQQVQDALYRLWYRICYHSFQASSLDLGSVAAELRFMTAVTPQFGVTGVVRIGGAHYARLKRKDR